MALDFDGDQKQPDLASLVARFCAPDVTALVLMGSHARGDAGPFSDVDLVRFHSHSGPAGDAETHFLGGNFVVVSDVYPHQIADSFTKPEHASTSIAGLRSARSLWDPAGFFAAIQVRAKAFIWDDVLQARADAWSSSQMVGWIEEVQKGLAGLKAGDVGRLLNARFGLTWGMVNVMRVQRGVLITSDNSAYPQVIEEMGATSRWATLAGIAYGLDGAQPLPGQVIAGLRLYIHTAELLARILRPDDRPLIDEAVRRITAELRASGYWEDIDPDRTIGR